MTNCARNSCGCGKKQGVISKKTRSSPWNEPQYKSREERLGLLRRLFLKRFLLKRLFLRRRLLLKMRISLERSPLLKRRVLLRMRLLLKRLLPRRLAIVSMKPKLILHEKTQLV